MVAIQLGQFPPSNHTITAVEIAGSGMVSLKGISAHRYSCCWPSEQYIMMPSLLVHGPSIVLTSLEDGAEVWSVHTSSAADIQQ